MSHYHDQAIYDSRDSHAARFWMNLLHQRLSRFCQVYRMSFSEPSIFLLDYLFTFERVGRDTLSLKKSCANVESQINELLA